ncbi:ADP-ribosylation factor 1 isoform X1 [Zea mays]|uniref:ADP-ribosylation factor n=1 Tax=Zea mays TaxID=4577 RepID=A0A804PLM0_MAIZE|nr:ADP-ribosylation factor 1 isoform X1 [Zea mays]|eukprot:XP_008646069.1 ADP-ribosylation factor 1 isoform X1 [Zea mays]
MGLAMGRLLGWKKEAQIALLGLGGAGKTAILHKLKLGHAITTGPTIGFNSETLEYNGISFRVWDVGGQGEVAHVSAAVLFLHSSTSVCSTYCAWHSDYHFDLQLRPLLRHYLYGVQGVVFVVDSSDREWILRAKDLLNIILDEDQFRNRDLALLVFANKQDRPNVMSAAEIADEFGLPSRLCNRRWHIQSSSAISGEGLHEGMAWLCTNIR